MAQWIRRSGLTFLLLINAVSGFVFSLFLVNIPYAFFFYPLLFLILFLFLFDLFLIIIKWSSASEYSISEYKSSYLY